MDEIAVAELVKNTQLFNGLSSDNFDQLMKSLAAVSYAPDTLIIAEGDAATAIYVLVEGSARVFTFDPQGRKVPLARLNAGDYFGEQAFIGGAARTRSASIEAITSLKLLEIDGELIAQLLATDNNLKAHLLEAGYQQALRSLAQVADFYGDLEALLPLSEHATLKTFANGEVIFNLGDQADAIYFIAQGKVQLLITDPQTGRQQALQLQRGQLFGEVGVLKQQPRAATAIANGNVKLIAVKETPFRSLVEHSPQLQKTLTSLQQIYQLPLGGIVEQYIGNVEGLGSAITTLYKLADGRSLVAYRVVDSDFFQMVTINQPSDRQYTFQHGDSRITLEMAGEQLCGLSASGTSELLPAACRMLLDGAPMEESLLQNFAKTGILGPTVSRLQQCGSDIICDCMMVSRGELQELIDQGIRDLPTLSERTAACTACRGCTQRILRMIGQSLWMAATMTRDAEHHTRIHSYYIKPLASHLHDFKAGQHLIIQVNINGLWIERPYTISGYDQQKGWRITIKREKGGYFTEWLFRQPLIQLAVNISQPQGEFSLKSSGGAPLLCFAGGIGITPFIAFAHHLRNSHSDQQMHLIYCAHAKDEWIFGDEFHAICNAVPHITITYRETAVEGQLTDQQISQEIEKAHNGHLYVCGPVGFTSRIQHVAKEMALDPMRFHSEQFVHAGSAS
jgi:ferredoxin-NADP reductase/CRP-like cAMP-binding protein